MEKYFELHNYSSMEKSTLSIYHLNGKSSIWWENLKNMKDIDAKKIKWDKFKKYFKNKYLLEWCYDQKRK